MEISKKGAYNLLRQNWLADPTIAVDNWQVEDYRSLDDSELLSRLEELGFYFDISDTEACASPEEYVLSLLDETDFDDDMQDRLYLLVFELWRRRLPEKMSLSLFCDELDHLMYASDTKETFDLEPLEDIITLLQTLLDDNADMGLEPKLAFYAVSQRCAGDLTDFLYDFIFAQIDGENIAYASELLDGFFPYLEDDLWFCLLKVRLLYEQDDKSAKRALSEVLEKTQSTPSLDFYFEILAVLVEVGDDDHLLDVAEQMIPLLETEEDFQELITFAIDFAEFSDEEEREKKLIRLLEKRGKKQDEELKSNDPAIDELLDILER